MRTCLRCKSTYPDEVNVCPVDGSTLDTRAGLDDTASIAPPDGSILPFAPFDPAFEAIGEHTDAALPPVGADAEDEKTRQDRPAHRRLPPKKASTRMPAASGGISQTSELERNDFSMLLSADPGGANLEPPESRIGKVVGSYRLLEIIGRGGMGCVYRAEHVKLGRDVALKLLREDYAQRRDAVTRFFQEARAVNLIRHRNIVDVIDYVELDDGNVFIIMELLAGHSMGRLMRGTIELDRAIGILGQICDGLSAAHAVGIVHRDLKPDNIIIVRSPDGGDLVKILDFGVAKLVDKYASDPDLTAVGAVIGTPAYMSPEQAGGLAVDPRADVYALGAIMYELFTHHLVFRAGTFGEFVRRHLNEPPKPPRQLPGCEEMDPQLEAIILRCLEKSPDARFQNALELRSSLVGLLARLGARAPAERPRDQSPSAGWAAPAAQSQVAARPAAARPAAMPPPIPAGARSGPMPVAYVTHGPTPLPAPAVDEDDDSVDAAVAAESDADDLDEATIEVPRDSAVRRAPAPAGLPEVFHVGNAQPSARETGPRRTGAVAQQSDDAAAPLAFGTPSPYSGLAQDLLRRAAVLPPASQTGQRAAQTAPAGLGAFDDSHVVDPAPRRARSLIAGAALFLLVAAVVAFAIPFLTRETDEQAIAAQPASTAAPGPGEPAAPPPRSAAPAPESAAPPAGPAATSPVVTPVVPERRDPAAPPGLAPEQPPAADDRAGRAHAADRGDSGRGAAARSAAPIRVRIVSRPVGELFSSGRRGALCETPCALTINPGDGDSDQHRVYVVKRPGYKDRKISIDLSDPPRQVRVDLEKVRASRGDRARRDTKGDEEEDGSDGAATDDAEDSAPPATDDDEQTSDGDSGADDAAKGKAKGKAKGGDDSTFNPFSDPNRSEE
jgi:eukaryotic-like serine/threonine-protein kinase